MGRRAGEALVGRAAELAVAEELLDAVGAGHGQVVIVEGEAGIGKTRFVDEVLARGRDRGFRIVAAACDEGERSRPFAAIGRALPMAAAAGSDAFHSVEPTSSSDWGPGQQFRLLDAVVAAVESLATNDTVVLALDDLHWADPGTLLSFRSIARRVVPLPVLLVGAHRVGHDVADLHRVVADTLRGGATHVDLGPLDQDAVVSLARELLGREPDAMTLANLEGARGNPLFITEFVRSTGSPGAATGVGTEAGGVPDEFRVGVLRRLGHLPADVQALLRLASVLGSQFGPAELATIAGSSVIALEPAIHQAVAAGIVEERGGALSFRHDLVRAALYEHIPLAVRRGLHREVGKALAVSGADAAMVARHLSMGATGPDEETARWLRRAAAETASRSPSVAADLLERCRDVLPPSSPERAEVLTELATTYGWAGRVADAEALAVDVLQRWPDTPRAHALRAAFVRALIWQGRPVEALGHAAIAADDPLDDPGARALAAEAALAAMWSFDMHKASGLAARAASAAERASDDLVLCQALSVQSWVQNFLGRPHEAVRLARRAIDLADRSPGMHAHLANPCFYAGISLIGLDRLEEAVRLLQEGRRHATDQGLVWSLPLFHAFLGVAKFVAGDWDGAAAEIEAGLAIADEIGISTTVLSSAAAWLAVMQVHRDEIDAAETTIRRAISRQRETGPRASPLLNWARAVVHEARGETDEALDLLQGAWNVFMAGGNITDPWSAMTLVRLCMATGDTGRAAALLPSVEAQATMADTPFMRGQALRCRGLVAADPDMLLAAVDEYRHCPRPHELGAAAEDAGDLLAASGRRDEAITLFDEAIASYERVDASRDVNRVRARLRALGVARRPRQGHVRATTGWGSLTPAERRVAELVEQRLSNPEIAERLFLSRHTVESHLKHIYRKVAVSSRVELARLAARHRDPVS